MPANKLFPDVGTGLEDIIVWLQQVKIKRYYLLLAKRGHWVREKVVLGTCIQNQDQSRKMAGRGDTLKQTHNHETIHF